MTIIIPPKRKFDAPPLVRTIDDTRDPLSEGLVGHWSMDAETVNGAMMLDLSGRDNHGTLINSPSLLPGRLRQALGLNGTSSYIDLGTPASLEVNYITISGWIYTFALNNFYYLFARDDGGSSRHYVLGIGANGYAPFYGVVWNTGGSLVELTSPTGGPYPVAQTWTHIALTYDGVTARYYMNGSLLTSGALAGTLKTGTAAKHLIGKSVNGPAYFPGWIDDVRIYNRALTQAEVFRLYNNPARERVPYQTRGRVTTITSGGPSIGSATGIGTATGIGRSLFLATGSATGIGTANGVSASSTQAVGAGFAPGIGTATGTGRSFFLANGSATGLGTAAATGLALFPAVGSATGNGVATATGRSLFTGTGSATGLGTATATSQIVFIGTGSATGLGTATGTGSQTFATITGTLVATQDPDSLGGFALVDPGGAGQANDTEYIYYARRRNRR